jgi:hydroxymethylbilane synthase
MKIILGTRGSPLALAQSRHVAASLKAAHPGLEIEERIIRTTGDKQQNAALPTIGGKGVFTLEIEAALLNEEIDFAVHSLKDLPPEMPDGLCLAAIPKRASASDVLIKSKIQNPKSKIFRVGTSSLRRRALVLHSHPDWKVLDVRGNVDTRLRKLEENFDAIILARAGLQRLQIEEELRERLRDLDETIFIPAPGQGALALQARSKGASTLALLRALEDESTRAEIEAERAIVQALNAGCSTPLGARATCASGVLALRACVLSPDGKQRIDAQAQDDEMARAEEVGINVALMLLDQGARELLA